MRHKACTHDRQVKKCFRKIIENRKKPKTEPMIDGKVGFLYLDKNDMPMVPCTGKNITSISVRNIIKYTKPKCQR